MGFLTGLGGILGWNGVNMIIEIDFGGNSEVEDWRSVFSSLATA